MVEFVVDPEMSYADIIVPTIDTVRAHFLLELLITNLKQVSLLVNLEIFKLKYFDCLRKF